ncbi:hypothetical protein GCM10009648_37650 [Tsukamurella spumae]
MRTPTTIIAKGRRATSAIGKYVGPAIDSIEGSFAAPAWAEVSWDMVAVTEGAFPRRPAASLDVPPWVPSGRAR